MQAPDTQEMQVLPDSHNDSSLLHRRLAALSDYGGVTMNALTHPSTVCMSAVMRCVS